MMGWSDGIGLLGVVVLLAAIYLQFGVVGALAALGLLLIVLSLWVARWEAIQRYRAKHKQADRG
jgi:hypothetical protein